VRHKVWNSETETQVRLEQLGINEAALYESVKNGCLARKRFTDNYPRISIGIAIWAEIVARLREILIPLGWEKSDKGNYELVVNQSLNIAIAVAAGDEFTGLSRATPSNKCPKGANTKEAISTNNQIDLFAEYLPIPIVSKDSISTWILLHYFADDEIRLELSLPSEIGVDGRIKGWSERIILQPIHLDEISVGFFSSEMQDIEIEVRRKA
jgi:hypothetical protein